MGRRGYPPELRRKVLDLVEAGRPIAEVAKTLGISDQSIYSWRRQDRIDRGLEPGLTSSEKAELAAAKRRIAELETELRAVRRAVELVREVVPPKGGSRRYHRAPHPRGEGLLRGGAGQLLPPGVGWSIDAAPTAALVTNALDMAIDRRIPPTGAIVHSDQGKQFASWAFTQRARDSGLVPSMGSVGDCYDNAMIEAFWSRMQVELLDRQRWHTRVELANAIFEYLEVFHNRQRRHSSLGMLTPLDRGSPGDRRVSPSAWVFGDCGCGC